MIFMMPDWTSRHQQDAYGPNILDQEKRVGLSSEEKEC